MDSFTNILNFRLKSVVVTGSPRSGTQIVAKILAQGLGKRFVPEKDFGAHDFNKMLSFLEIPSVIHAPGLSHKIEDMPDWVGVVFVVRDFKDIIASQERIGWKYEHLEREKYFKEFGIPVDDSRPICIFCTAK